MVRRRSVTRIKAELPFCCKKHAWLLTIFLINFVLSSLEWQRMRGLGSFDLLASQEILKLHFSRRLHQNRTPTFFLVS
jgi:hypothetical protein